jgi:hypothetical protein
MSKKIANQRAEDEATLRRNRSFGGGISRAVDHILTERSELRDALDEVYTHCYNTIAYFPESAEEKEMCKRIDALLKKTEGS